MLSALRAEEDRARRATSLEAVDRRYREGGAFEGRDAPLIQILALPDSDTPGPIQVSKAVHHRAANDDSNNWLKAVRPQNVVVSVDENNHDHPTQKALDLYRFCL